MRFPLYKNDNIPMIELSETQKKAVELFKCKIASGKYKLIINNCMCNNKNNELDVVLSEKDRFGIGIEQIICSKCGLIRSAKVLDKEGNVDFYKNDYRNIYVGSSLASEEFFLEQRKRGESFLLLLEKVLENNNIKTVLEIGCGAGGILYPFLLKGYKCIGVDYNEKYLSYGKNMGIDVICGDFNSNVPPKSVDFLILSHVMEHFLNPIEEMQNVIDKVKDNGYILVEVPGIFDIESTYGNPLKYLQNAHVYNYYYYDYLCVFFETLGLKVLYGNERCTFIVEKQIGWRKKDLQEIYNEKLNVYPEKVEKYLYNLQKFAFYYGLKHNLKHNLIKYVVFILDTLGMKEIIKKILGRIKNV